MKEILLALFISLGCCLITGPVLIPALRRLKFGQSVRDDGPKSHLQKQGTPTMGGVMLFFSLTIAVIFMAKGHLVPFVLLAFTLGYGLIGFLDDYIKIVKKRSLGLKPMQKIVGQLVLSGLLAYVAITYLGLSTAIIVPYFGIEIELGWLYIPFVIFLAIGTTNAVNLTDGLDGLASGVTVFVGLGYALIGLYLNDYGVTMFSVALVGSCIGFLFFNSHPAKVFMGDTGSLALGGAVAALAVVTKTELFLPILGAVYVMEAVSVILQVSFYKWKKRRIFLMAPLHHHYELKGWSEQKVVFVFWTTAAAFVILSLALIKITGIDGIMMLKQSIGG